MCIPLLSWVYRALLASRTSCLTRSLSSYFSLSSLPIPHLSSLAKSMGAYVSNISEAEAGKPQVLGSCRLYSKLESQEKEVPGFTENWVRVC